MFIQAMLASSLYRQQRDDSEDVAEERLSHAIPSEKKRSHRSPSNKKRELPKQGSIMSDYFGTSRSVLILSVLY